MVISEGKCIRKFKKYMKEHYDPKKIITENDFWSLMEYELWNCLNEDEKMYLFNFNEVGEYEDFVNENFDEIFEGYTLE